MSDPAPMKCDVLRPGWLHGCTSVVKWWWREQPTDKYKWHPRCGMHARLPGNTKAERVPITEPNPDELHAQGRDTNGKDLIK